MRGAAPDLESFRRLATSRRVIPVVRRVLADGHTPLGLYHALARHRAGTFLFESAEHGRTWSRWSFIGVRSAAMLTAIDGQAHWVGAAPVGVPTSGDALVALRDTIQLLHTERLDDVVEGLPPLTSGMVGAITYDAVRHFERLPHTAPDELGLPGIAMLLATDLAAFDHHSGTVTLIANAINFDNTDARVDEAWADAVSRLDAMEQDLSQASPMSPAIVDTQATIDVRSRTTPEDFIAAVEKTKEYIRAGDAFQVVLSQRFEMDTTASAFDVYRMLRLSNPSPYMYLMRFPDVSDFSKTAFDVVGSSPEALVQLRQGRAMVHPIAGTRPRGATPEQDQEFADELLADKKERAEHLMLVDLGRNDLGRVCAPGTVDVVEFMAIERFSHVMHIVSTVVGKLAADKTAYDLLRATFPAGTLSGAPKPRAMEIIEELEPSRRGVYGGCVGYLDFAGDMDTAIAIRTAVIKSGVAYVQAGAGVVADSNPALEEQECRHKAASAIRAVAAAASLKSAGMA